MQYEPTWGSLDHHRSPEWYHDAKFGLFVHYIPSRYEGQEYPEPTNYSAEEWVDLAETAGMQYIIPTAKHGDGHTSWPSNHSEFGADRVGGPRDIVTPLAEAAREAGLKFGLYYCWDEHRNADYPDQETYVLETTAEERFEHEPRELKDEIRENAHDRIEEFVRLYHPSLIWFDGRHPSWATDEEYRTQDVWRGRELVAWYYNQAERREQDVCVNDRLDSMCTYSDVRDDPELDPHGDFWNAGDHNLMDEAFARKWEICETTHDGWTWSPSRTWKDAEGLVRLLIDVVSKNGNLLLNVGPKPDGSIPEGDRELLEAIGAWLDVNGEAIYGTRPFREPKETVDIVPDIWSIDGEDNEERRRIAWEMVTEYLEDTGPIRLTRRETVAYALHFGWPGETLRLTDVPVRDGATITMLGVDEELDWDDSGGELSISTPDARPCEHAFAFRVPLPVEETA